MALRISVVPMDNNCDVDLYVNEGQNNFPDRDNALIYGGRYGGDYIVIKKGDYNIQSFNMVILNNLHG